MIRTAPSYSSVVKSALIMMTLFSVGCQSGDTDGGKGSDLDFRDEVFVGSDDKTGSIRLKPVKTELRIGELGGYFVEVRDVNGRPVPNVQVACDTEVGLPIIEPTRGFELTDDGGAISGKIACEVPGSLQMVCRLPTAGNKRDFVGIKCIGDIPQGFRGFSGTAGEGLGGGVAVVDDENIAGSVRITSIQLVDDGSGTTATTSIDVTRSLCGTGASASPEPFFDTSVNIKVLNNSTRTLRFLKLSYSIDDADGSGGQFNSKEISLIGEAEAGGTVDLSAIIFDANSNGKRFVDSASNIPSSLGFRSITFRIFGSDSNNNQFIVAARTAVSFDDFNNCGG